ncbi:MAG: hypothetical protein COB93_08395 [Sneathiella sp.]|nr:MAG: hypothetical protein COB93_08395 [Sneathiella sp.]
MDEKENMATTGGGSFHIVLHPSQSLSRSGFIILMSAVITVSFAAGVFFMAIGAWPVFGFFGLDVLLLYGAFKFSFRNGRRREVIEIRNDKFQILRIAANGQSMPTEFQAYWARVLIAKGQLWVTNRGSSYELGQFLGEEEKEEVRELIAQALRTYRTGGNLQSPSPNTSIIS